MIKKIFSPTQLVRRALISGLIQSHSCRFSTSIVSVIPSNLILADSTVLQPAKPSVIPPEEYLFPKLNIDTKIPVHILTSPGTLASEPAILNPEVFGVAIRKDIVHDVIRYHRAKLRQPKRTKRMSELRGSNKKPWPQKGTGRSQVGHRRNSVWRGGQKAHGPVLRSYAFHINRKQRAKALMIALAAKHREGNLLVVDNMLLEDHKTTKFTALLAGHGLDRNSCIFVDNHFTFTFALASRNVKKVVRQTMLGLHAYELVRREKLVITVAALQSLQERLVSQSTHESNRRSMINRITAYQAFVSRGQNLPAVNCAPQVPSAIDAFIQKQAIDPRVDRFKRAAQ